MFIYRLHRYFLFQLYRGGQFIGGGNRSTRRKPPTCCKSLIIFIVWCCIYLKCTFQVHLAYVVSVIDYNISLFRTASRSNYAIIDYTMLHVYLSSAKRKKLTFLINYLKESLLFDFLIGSWNKSPLFLHCVTLVRYTRMQTIDKRADTAKAKVLTLQQFTDRLNNESVTGA
jgi:hypothetical protein